MERVFISDDIYLLELKEGRFTPYKIINGKGYPIRGKNKRGNSCWRTYKSVEEARENVFGE